MTIEELKSKRERFRLRSKLGYADFIGEEACNLAISLIDEKILQLSITDEDVQEALWHFNLMLKARKVQEEETRKHYGGDLPSFEVAANKYEILAIQALQQMRTEGCHYCKGIENHEIDKIKVVIDKLGRELDAYNIPYNYCTNCGRKLRAE